MSNTYPVRLQVPETQNLPGDVLMWAQAADIEESALDQIRSVAQLPGLYGLRVMPDVHWGNGATVGSVIAMEQALAPAAVGVDIGCGVNAVKTNININDIDAIDLKILRDRFENTIPVGFSSYHEEGEQFTGLDIRVVSDAVSHLDRVGGIRANLTSRKKNGDIVTSDAMARSRAAYQLGTLGGGNHFIELCTDSVGDVWITLHSGSRNLGKVVAEAHIEKAKALPENKDLPKHLQDLALFFKGTPQMDDYLHDLRYAQRFAMFSRTVMMERIKREIDDYFWDKKYNVIFEDEINCHHNYVAEEIIDGREMIVTRKGAISAKKGERALIPGSMATGSYIIRGLGNDASFQSASHGAGRKMSRKQAIRTYTVEDLEKAMVGIEARTDIDVLDEIPMAYKNLDDVISSQKDLVQVEEKLDTILCVKG